MSRSFFQAIILVNFINLLVLIVAPIILSDNLSKVLHPLIVAIVGLLLIVCFFLTRILNTIYLLKDRYRIAGFVNIGLIVSFICTTFMEVSVNSNLFEAKQHHDISNILTIIYVLLGLTFGVSILLTKNRSNKWLKIFALIDLFAVVLNTIEKKIVDESGQEQVKSSIDFIVVYFAVASTIFLLLHLLKRKKQVMIFVDNENIVDTIES